jgi:hypothetical protein
MLSPKGSIWKRLSPRDIIDNTNGLEQHLLPLLKSH